LLDYKYYGLTEADLDKDFHIDLPMWNGILSRKKTFKLREIIDQLRTAYCGKIGVEYMHIPQRE
jgi:2-oxoglutarate dehydrogenase E1 component